MRQHKEHQSDDDRDREKTEKTVAAEILERLVRHKNGRALTDDERDAAGDALHAQRCNERRELEARYEQAAHKTAQHARAAREDHARDKRQAEIHQRQRADRAGERFHRADGKVHLPADQNKRHADGAHHNVRGLQENVGDIRPLQEVR